MLICILLEKKTLIKKISYRTNFIPSNTCKTQTHNNKICVNFIENPHLGGEMRANFWTSAAALELFPTATPFGSISQINFGSSIVVFYDAGGIFRFLNT